MGLWFPCCPGTPVCEEVTAGGCTRDASSYFLTTPTLTDGTCSDSELWSGTFELVNVPDYAIWNSPASTSTACGHTSGDPLWRCWYEVTGGAGYYYLEALGLGYRWRRDGTSWCTSPVGTQAFTRISPYFMPEKVNGFTFGMSLIPCWDV